VPVVHDLAFQHFPESAPHIDERWRRRFAATLAEAPAIIVPSTSAAQDLHGSFGVAGARVHVVHHGVDAEAFAPVSDAAVDAVRRRYGIPGPYVLFVGGIEPRKNLEHLVRANGPPSREILFLLGAQFGLGE
jgi:glycosyltransferase involved in cell wall biosynthesis